ncbi:1-acyl-sn-glycerol-3-phosphate acyltransferase [candidate division KSB1 bacterium]|nr:1-acyl-sn-glycerol-3-phosphate acyltransferase [candidate division KSB1 bacterium]
MNSDDKVIFAFNHNSSYETVLVAACLHYLRNGRKVAFLVDWMYGYAPVFGWIVRKTEPIFVFTKPATFSFMKRRKKKLTIQNVLDASKGKIEENQAIAIFPEGTRNKHPYKLKRARHGLVKLVLEADVPVIPLGIDFPSRIKKGKIPKFGRIIFRAGSALSFHDESQRYFQTLSSKTLSKDQKNIIINTLYSDITDTVMLNISVLCGKHYPFSKDASPTNQ